MKRARCVRSIVVGALVVGWTAIASPAELTCAANAAVAPTVRGEGLTELVSDVVLACTEIGLLVDPDDSPLPLIDSAAVHARELGRATLGQPAPELVRS